MSLLWIYCIVIIVLSIAYVIFFSHRKKISKTLVGQLDTLLYEYDKNIVLHKNTIYDFDTTKKLLFHNQIGFFSTGKNYQELCIPLLKDVDYIQTLLQKDIVPQSMIKIIKATYITQQKLYTLKEYTHIILIILTLGIAKLLLP